MEEFVEYIIAVRTDFEMFRGSFTERLDDEDERCEETSMMLGSGL